MGKLPSKCDRRYELELLIRHPNYTVVGDQSYGFVLVNYYLRNQPRNSRLVTMLLDDKY